MSEAGFSSSAQTPDSATPSTPELVETFVRAATAAAALVERAQRTPEAIFTALRHWIEGATRIVIAEPKLLEEGLFVPLRTMPGVIPEPTDEQLANAEIGITEAFAGVVGTGSVCVALGPSLTAAASLLMPLHIVLLPAERIVARPRDLFDPSFRRSDGRAANFVIITGPSATADMGPLVRGVHGPHRLHILVLEQGR